MQNEKKLTPSETIALGCMTLALFLGAGNIIFPPYVGMQAGGNSLAAGAGFILSAVLFPALAIVSLAINKGDINALTQPLGKIASFIFCSICFLTLSVLVGTPRTATISFELMSNNSGTPIEKLLFSISFFTLAGLVLAKPRKFLEIVGFVLSPLKIGALIFIGVCAWVHPIGSLTTTAANYQMHAFQVGFINGYQTLDVLGALCFGAIITHTLKQRGIEQNHSILRYSAIAAIIAAAGLTLIYICYISMGAHTPSDNASNGLQIMSLYVDTVFGSSGRILLTMLITLACLVTAIGLTTGFARYFNQQTGIPYGVIVLFSLVSSAAISVLGLDTLTSYAVPLLFTLYPATLVVVILGAIRRWIEIPENLYQLIFYSALSVGIMSLFVRV